MKATGYSRGYERTNVSQFENNNERAGGTNKGRKREKKKKKKERGREGRREKKMMINCDDAIKVKHDISRCSPRQIWEQIRRRVASTVKTSPRRKDLLEKYSESMQIVPSLSPPR